MDFTIVYQNQSDFILKKLPLETKIYDIKQKLKELHGFPIDQ
jgi:hypothetical protein